MISNGIGLGFTFVGFIFFCLIKEDFKRKNNEDKYETQDCFLSDNCKEDD